MKFIPLTRGKFAIVDDEDYDWFSQWKWFCSNNGYAMRRASAYEKHVGRSCLIQLHREIIGTPDGLYTDHINGDKLDNRKSNLRQCYKYENCWNSGKRKTNTTGYKGVQFYKRKGLYVAMLRHLGKTKRSRYFKTAEEAADWYREWSIKLHGEFSNTS